MCINNEIGFCVLTRHSAKKKDILGLGPGCGPKPKPETNINSELYSLYFGIEINKRLKFLTLKFFGSIKCEKNIRKFFLKTFKKVRNF